jgi:preprotein translocase subunit YajC
VFVTPAFAQGAPAGDLMSQLGILPPMILVMIIMWFLIIRPQQRRVKEHQEMVKNVRRGDTVVTTGGILGKVTKVADEATEIEVEIADNVRVKVLRTMLAEVRTKGEPVKAA